MVKEKARLYQYQRYSQPDLVTVKVADLEERVSRAWHVHGAAVPEPIWDRLVREIFTTQHRSSTRSCLRRMGIGWMGRLLKRGSTITRRSWDPACVCGVYLFLYDHLAIVRAF
jgi:hypothetical protein